MVNNGMRYVTVIAREWPERRFKAALAYSDNLSEACVTAHTFGSSASPCEVYDTETRTATGEPVRVHTTARNGGRA